MILIKLPEKLSANKMYAGMHWSVRKRIADDFHLAVLAAVRSQQIKAVDSSNYPVRVKYEFCLAGVLDVSNTFSMVKLVEDGLVKAGVIVGDSQKYVKEITTSIIKTKSKIPVVVVSIMV